MDESIILFAKYRDTIKEYDKLSKLHYIKRRRLKKQIKNMKNEIHTYNNPEHIFSFVNGIYVLLSTTLYTCIEQDKQFSNIRIVSGSLQIKPKDDITVWFMVKRQWFEVMEPDLSYEVHKQYQIENTKVLERWHQLCPLIFSALEPIITIKTIPQEEE